MVYKDITIDKIKKRTVYFAGKISKNDWRHQIVTGLRSVDYWSFERENPKALMSFPINFKPYKNDNFSKLSEKEKDELIYYSGPFFISCDHGCSHGNSTHGSGTSQCSEKAPSRDDIFNLCVNQIDESDWIFCWIDSLDCYGTLFELGVAHEKGKKIFIGIDSKLGCSDLWFIKQCGLTSYCESPLEAWNNFLDAGPMKVSEKEREDFVKTLNIQELEDFKSIKNTQPMSKTINYFKRNRKIVYELKKLYNGKCQICQGTFEKENGDNYCETHHVKALGKNGTDTIDNLVVLCPTCHRKLHYAKEKEFDIKYKEEHYNLIEAKD